MWKPLKDQRLGYPRNQSEGKTDFSGKSDALDMIADIKSKIAKSEKVQNYVIEGLKSTLTNAGLQTELDNALKELN